MTLANTPIQFHPEDPRVQELLTGKEEFSVKNETGCWSNSPYAGFVFASKDRYAKAPTSFLHCDKDIPFEKSTAAQIIRMSEKGETRIFTNTLGGMNFILPLKNDSSSLFMPTMAPGVITRNHDGIILGIELLLSIDDSTDVCPIVIRKKVNSTYRQPYSLIMASLLLEMKDTTQLCAVLNPIENVSFDDHSITIWTGTRSRQTPQGISFSRDRIGASEFLDHVISTRIITASTL